MAFDGGALGPTRQETRHEMIVDLAWLALSIVAENRKASKEETNCAQKPGAETREVRRSEPRRPEPRRPEPGRSSPWAKRRGDRRSSPAPITQRAADHRTGLGVNA